MVTTKPSTQYQRTNEICETFRLELDNLYAKYSRILIKAGIDPKEAKALLTGEESKGSGYWLEDVWFECNEKKA